MDINTIRTMNLVFKRVGGKPSADRRKFVAGLRKAALGFGIWPWLNFLLLTLAWCRPALHQAYNYPGALGGTAPDLKESREQKNPMF